MPSRIKQIVFSVFLGALLLFAFVSPTLAQNATDTFGIAPVGDNINLAGGDIREIAARIINVALGLLGLVAFGLILYGGFLYMTSGGSEDKIAEGKKYIINATIGLVIILSAWSIVLFVFKQLNDAINGDGAITDEILDDEIPFDVCDPDSPNYNEKQCANFCAEHPEYDVCQDTVFYVKAITPGAFDEKLVATGMNNITVRVLFSRPINKDIDLAKSLTITRGDGAVPITVSILENNRVLEAKYFEDGLVKPFRVSSDRPYLVTVSPDLKDSTGKTLEAEYEYRDNKYKNYSSFTVDVDQIDATKPVISPILLNGLSGTNLAFVKNSNLTISATLNDRLVEVYGGNGLVKIMIAPSGGQALVTGYAAPNGRNGSSDKFLFDYTTKLGANFTVGQKYTVTVTGYDIDGNVQTTIVTFSIKAAHCDNEIKDEDETDVDSGGSCGGGEGDFCDEEKPCSSGFQCVDKKCTAAPEITSLDPGNGAPGNWITINGKSFGTKPGKVYFGVDRDDNQKYEDSEWVEAAVVNCGSGASWNPYWVVVAVPGPNAEFADGAKRPIKLVTGDGKTFDTTINDFGAKPNSDGLFVINSTQRPGLCRVGVTADTEITLKDGSKVTLLANSEAAVSEVGVTAKGSGFGTKGTGDKLVFGATKNPVTGALSGGFVADTSSGANWTDLAIKTKVPVNLKPTKYAVHVGVGDQSSNGVKFSVLSPDQGVIVPNISSIDPTSTTQLSLITIKGKGFGNTIGQVFLYGADRPGNALTACANNEPDCKLLNVVDLPAQCGNTWSNTQIIGQIPAGMQMVKTKVIVKNNLGLVTAGQDFVTIEGGDPRPGICRIAPNSGPAPLPNNSQGIAIYGINFSTINPSLFFWQSGADPAKFNTWLDSSRDRFNGFDVIKDNSSIKITTLLPVSSNGRSMSTGPIKVKNWMNQTLSNGVDYTVDSCVNSKTPLSGYHCCAQGPDAGQWKQNNRACEGEAREAGYLWRFTTGILAYAPSVVEQCSDSTDVYPSPTPRVKATSLVNTTACINSTIAVRFTMGMDETTLNQNTIKVYTCPAGADGRIDCSKDKKSVNPLTFDYENGSNTLVIRESPPAPTLTPQTWYQVELSTAVKSLQNSKLLGKNTTSSAGLLSTKPCGTGTAYCYSFRTSGVECTLTDAGINPSTYTARQLGIIQDQRFPIDYSSLFLPTSNSLEKEPPYPVYFKVWGKGNQECSVLNVDQYPWQWTPGLTGVNSDKASVFKAPKSTVFNSTTIIKYQNSRAMVAARTHTAPAFVPIKAEATIEYKTSNSPNSTPGTIGGTDILATAGLAVASNGYTPGKPVELSSAVNDLLSLQDTFTLQFKYSKSPSLVRANLLEKRNPTAPQTGYRVRLFNTNSICFWSFDATGSAQGGEFCFVPTPDVSGVYNVTLSWDKNGTKDIVWSDLNNLSNRVESGLNQMPVSTGKATLVSSSLSPVTDPGPIFYGFNKSDEVADFSISGTVNFAPISKLTIDLADPAVTYFEPNCTESCVNATVRADFNRQMDPATYAAGFKFYKCLDGVTCANAVTSTQYVIDTARSNFTTLAAMLIEGGPNLDPNTYYKVSLNGPATNGAIKAILSENPKVLSKSLPTFEWIFKTKNDGKPCSVNSLVVEPVSFKAIEVGQKDKFTVVPYSAPNACSRVGQALNKWGYTYTWNTADILVAKISDLTPAFYSNIKPGCTSYCVKKGSTIPSDSTATSTPMCGNGEVEDGEDCDVAKAGETTPTSCNLSCLRPGNDQTFTPQKTSNTCGNGTVEPYFGEQCDPGKTGDAVNNNNPFCTSHCTLRGSSTQATGKVGVAICGDGFVTSGQESCDINDVNTSQGCTSECLHAGTKLTSYWCTGSGSTYLNHPACVASLSVCGNGKVETGEDCEAGSNNIPASACSTQCLFLDVCAVPTGKQCNKGEPGCTDRCTLAGSKTTYSNPSVCGDTKKGTGENLSCEVVVSTTPTGLPTSGPVQVVEAVGNGTVKTGTDYQQTKINVSTKEGSKTVTGAADYKLQCGYTEYVTPTNGSFSGKYNDCSWNPGNFLGVDAQSCCLPRPRRTDEYPADGAGFSGSVGVCRNTYIEVEFSKEILPETITQNMFLVRGFNAANVDCAVGTVGGQDVTQFVSDMMATTISKAGAGFWSRTWDSITGWFKNLFGTNVSATTLKNTQEFKSMRTWCTTGIPVTIDTRRAAEGNQTFSKTSLAISQVLEADTIYGVLLRGDKGGVTDLRGVPLRAHDSPSRNDSWFFMTGSKICKITDVLVDPANQLFNKPNQAHSFKALAFSTDGTVDSRIVPVTGYSWTWTWLPQNNPVFTFAQQTPNDNLLVTSKTAPGHITGIAQAKITEDAYLENNQKGKIFSGTFELTAFYCENPWPAANHFPYTNNQYNFTTSYCADDGTPNSTGDDYPLLDQTLTSLEEISGSTETLQKGVFFNDKNDDVIGLQIFSSTGSLYEWYLEKFTTMGAMKPTTIGGYQALTDQNNYYVQALNLSAGLTTSPNDDIVYKNIYLFSINPNADARTRKIFQEFLKNLEFNINVKNHNLCLAPGGNIRTSPEIINQEVGCTTDFDCRDAVGVEKAGTIGTCSNALTKFKRDWERLADVREAQDLLDGYFADHTNDVDFKGSLAAGTFTPGYTVSRWGQSWGNWKNQDLAGAPLPTDPLNKWTDCSTSDKQTCWNQANTTYYCPRFASVYEYEYVSSTRSYIFHAPLEYFTAQDSITQKEIALENFSAERWFGCSSGQYNPFKAQCGDGVLTSGEQCEPPGKVTFETQYPANADQLGKCSNWPVAKSCEIDPLYGEASLNNNCGSSNNDGFHYFFGPGACAAPNGIPIVIEEGDFFGEHLDLTEYNKTSSKSHVILFSCVLDSTCNAAATYNYGNADKIYVRNEAKLSESTSYTREDFVDNFVTAPQNAGKFKCVQITASDKMTPGECVGFKKAGTFDAICPANSEVPVTCSNQCQRQYGTCKALGSCGNGVVEGSEACDDGALNGTYGHCNAATATAPGCTGLDTVAGYCGNLKKDFVDTDKDGVKDTNEKDLEFCDPSVQNSTFTANYNLDRTKSCSWDCQSTAGYCGDTIVQGDEGEECDDGNNKDDNKCLANCQLPAVSCLQALVTAKAAGNLSIETDSPPTSTTYFIPYVTTNYTDPDLTSKFRGGEACAVATPRALCAAASLECKNVTIQNKNSTLTPIPCTNNFSGPGGTKKVADTSLQTILYPQATTTQVLSVECKGIYNPAGANSNDTNAAPICGNGKIDPELKEDCDNGLNNDVECVPKAGEPRCTYCGGGCKIQTIESSVFCGNGQIDAGEQCDFAGGGIIRRKFDELYCGQFFNICSGACIAQGNGASNTACMKTCTDAKTVCLNNTASVAASCSELGSYQCSSDCKKLDNQCISCGAKPNGSFALVNILNPISVNWKEWQDSDTYTINLYHPVKNSSGAAVQTRLGSQKINNFSFPNAYFGFSTSPTSGNIRIESSLQCAANYSVAFNVDKIQSGSPSTLANPSTLPGTIFSYPVAGQGESVLNDLIMSPAVAQGTFRVILVWTDKEKSQGAKFSGGVYHKDYDYVDPGGDTVLDTQEWYDRATLGSNAHELCSRMKKSGGYWVPTAGVTATGVTETCSDTGQVEMGPTQGSLSGKTFIQSFTIEADYWAQSQKSFAFFVKAIDKDIYDYRTSNLEVWVYQHRPGQNNLFSVYEPVHKFKIKDAVGDSSASHIWHAFNLVVDGQAYKVERVPKLEANGDKVGDYQGGMLQSKFCRTQEHMPGSNEHCSN